MTAPSIQSGAANPEAGAKAEASASAQAIRRGLRRREAEPDMRQANHAQPRCVPHRTRRSLAWTQSGFRRRARARGGDRAYDLFRLDEDDLRAVPREEVFFAADVRPRAAPVRDVPR